MTVGLSAWLRRLFPGTSRGERVAGTILGLLVCAVSWGGTMALLLFCGILSPWLSFAVQSILSYQLLGTRALRDAGARVYAALRRGDQASARCALSALTAGEAAGHVFFGFTPQRRLHPQLHLRRLRGDGRPMS